MEYTMSLNQKAHIVPDDIIVEDYAPNKRKSSRKKWSAEIKKMMDEIKEVKASSEERNASTILRSVAKLIEDRASDRDVEKERSISTTVELFRTITGHQLSEYEGWLFMVCLKLARNRKGTGVFNEDHLLDAMGYLALALESTDS